MKIAYFIHVPWKWIKQRPHFIAEQLEINNEVVILEWRPFAKHYRSKKKEKPNLLSYFIFPKDRIGIIHIINKVLFSLQTRKILDDADIIWLTYPEQNRLLRLSKYKGRIIYDCMDDHPEFFTKTERLNIIRQEKLLINKSDAILASSSYLKEKLLSRYGNKSIYVINNAIADGVFDSINVQSEITNITFDKCRFSILYIGTISNWFDFELIRMVLDNNPKAILYLVGPKDTNIPVDERIVYCGKVNHAQVFPLMQKADALIMPFVLNELILSVNPVKLYEYVFSGKPCIAPYYSESIPFEDYVYLYHTKEECSAIVCELSNGKGAKRSLEECREFAKNNTWKQRVNQIELILKKTFQ